MIHQQKYNSNYIGIVIQNNDPKGKGRIKVYVPHVSPTVYKRWNELSEDKKFKFLGKNIDSDLSRIVHELKEILPWCNCASPLIGENSSGRYNTNLDYGSTSDSSFYGLSGFQSGGPYTPDSNDTTTDGTGENEGAIYEKYKTKLSDPFSDPKTNNVNQVNLYAHEYTPSTYSNKAKGTFGIPAVGSHVWVFFYDGDPHYPVYFAAFHGRGDWNEIYDYKNNSGLDYPSSYENNSLSAVTPDLEQYRSKTLINQKGGSIEVVNSDGRESIKMSHYSGSFKGFTNATNVELAVHNDQKLVNEDQFYTVKGYRNLYIGKDEDHNVKGDYYLKVGNLNVESFALWKDVVGGIANIKQLFDIRRAEKIDSEFIKYTSTLQTREGDFAVCPVCLGAKGKEYKVINNVSSIQEFVPDVLSNNNQVTDYSNVTQPLYGSPASLRKFPPTIRCPVCKGTGKSPSSKNGEWVAETFKDYENLKNLYNSKIVELAQIESRMGIGGNHVIDITKHKVETIGLVMNDFGSIRVDLIGKINNNAVLVDDNGVFVSQKESPITEYVHVDDMPGGNYTLNVCNRYSLNVGAGGMSLKSFGPVNISGTITNIGGVQVNISGQTEVNINAQNRLMLQSDIVILKNKTGGQVLVDSNLGVNGNAIIRGGMHVDGELSVNHITAPYEIQTTELAKIFAKLLSGLQFNCNISGVEPGPGVANVIVTLTADSNDNKVECYDHSHHFKNIPLKLVAGNDQLRLLAKANNETQINPALPIVNEYKPN